MAITPNYSWVTPAPTDFVTDLPADFETFADAVDDTVKDLNPGTTAGDLDYYTSSTAKARLGIGTAGQVLKVNSGATAPEWGTVSVSPTFAGCVLQLASAVSINNATITTVDFTTEVIDTDGYHDNSTNPSRITIPAGKAGKYFVFAQAAFDATSGGGFQRVWIAKNGTDVATGLEPRVSLSSQEQSTNTSIVVDMAVGDYFTMKVRQDSGTAKNLESTLKTAFFAYYLGA